jgi:hypothetical protein
MMHFPYVGSGPYCYANAFAMMFGPDAPSTAVIEFATGSPFGMQLTDDRHPFFDPYGWTPEAGFDDALAAMGWRSEVDKGADADDALARLRAALTEGPVWVGPVEMGHLRHQPGREGAIGADHYVVVLAIEGERVVMHDPESFPYASLPLNHFIEAWRASALVYGSPFTMRTAFQRVRIISEEEVIRRSIPMGMRWLAMEIESPVSMLGNAAAAERLAQLVAAGCDAGLRYHLTDFAVRVGARRRVDAATCLMRIGYEREAAIMDAQARCIGALQYDLVVGNDAAAAAALRKLAPSFVELYAAFEERGDRAELPS